MEKKVKLSKIERKILFALKLYGNSVVGYRELKGYLHFPPLETTYNALAKLEKLGLIRKIESDRYIITEEGKEQMRFRPLESPLLKDFLKILVTAAVTTMLNQLFGVTG